ncbi:hypothetical protein [Moraxella lacunata]|uniref:hypothetical protein n=1 Tax=Moraxella lacunata TaxID=477 RepID=UPI003EE16C6A
MSVKIYFYRHPRNFKITANTMMFGCRGVLCTPCVVMSSKGVLSTPANPWQISSWLGVHLPFDKVLIFGRIAIRPYTSKF